MTPPYFIVRLKADLSLDDCVDFINSLTEKGERRFRNLFVALPFTRLQEMVKAFPDSGIVFGALELNRVDSGAFTAPIAAKMVKDVGGQFALIGSQEERSVHGLTDEQIKGKLKVAQSGGLKAIYCVGGENLKAQLQVLKDADILSSDSHPIIAYELPFKTFKSYLPSQDELKELSSAIKGAIKDTFKEQIGVVAALPNDLVGFSSLVEEMPFEGAFFTKSGIYPHAVHQETMQLFHVHCSEIEGEAKPKRKKESD